MFDSFGIHCQNIELETIFHQISLNFEGRKVFKGWVWCKIQSGTNVPLNNHRAKINKLDGTTSLFTILIVNPAEGISLNLALRPARNPSKHYNQEWPILQ